MSSPNPPNLHHLNEFGLQLHCQQETDRFFIKGEADRRYCFELFRRALHQPPHPSSDQAWTAITTIYTPLVKKWLRQFGPDHLSESEKNTLITDSFHNLWLAFAQQRVAWQNFANLAAILKYLYWQVRGSIKTYTTQKQTETLDEANVLLLYNAADTVVLEEAWHCITPWLKGEQEQIVAYYTFIEGLKPRHIWDLYRTTNIFKNTKEISRVNERLLKRMKPFEAEIRQCLKG